MCMVPRHALEAKNYPTGLGGHESMGVLLFLLFSFKRIYECMYQCVISL
jgi:hypothetical protein